MIGGGMTRDVLLAEIPTVLRADLYAALDAQFAAFTPGSARANAG